MNQDITNNAFAHQINYFTAQRNIDKESLRIYLNGGKKEPVKQDVSLIRQKIAVYIKDEKERREIDSYLKRIEEDYSYIQKMAI